MTKFEADESVGSSLGTGTSGKTNGIPNWVFWLVPVALAVVLRWISIDLNSLSHDELSTWARTEYPRLRGVIQYGVVPDYHPPGHFMLVWVIKQLGWESAFALRLPSVLAGIVSVGVLYRIGCSLFDRWTGSMAALLMATSWPLVFYSQDARSYALLVLFVLLCIDASVRVVDALQGDESPRRRDWIQLVLAGAAAAYFHYYGLFFVGLLGMGSVLVLLPHVKAALRASLGFSAILVLYAPWASTLIDDLGHSKTWVVRHGIDFFPRWWTWILGEMDETALFAACVVVLGGFAAVVRKEDKKATLRWSATILVLAWLVMPGLVAFLKSLWSTPALTNRNILPSAPAAMLLIAHAIRWFPGKVFVRLGLFAWLFGTMLWGLVSVKDYYNQPTKEEYRDVVQTITDHDADVLFARCGIRSHFAYYLKQYGSTVEMDKNMCRERQIEEFAERNVGRSMTFVRVHYKPDQAVLDYLDENYLTTQLFKQRDAVAMMLVPREPVVELVEVQDDAMPPQPTIDGLAEESAGSEEEEKAPPVEAGCDPGFPPLNRVGAWGMWPYRPGQLMDTTESGIRFRRDTLDDGRANLCMKGRIPVDGAVQISGSWMAQFDDEGGSAQLSARYYGSDGKWVSGEDDQRPVWLVKTTKKSIKTLAFDKTFQPPSDAAAVQLCLILSGTKGMIELTDVCVQAPH